jgi:hypothetical protein
MDNKISTKRGQQYLHKRDKKIFKRRDNKISTKRGQQYLHKMDKKIFKRRDNNISTKRDSKIFRKKGIARSPQKWTTRSLKTETTNSPYQTTKPSITIVHRKPSITTIHNKPSITEKKVVNTPTHVTTRGEHPLDY